MGVSQSLWLNETEYSVASNTSTVRIVWSSTQSGGSWNGYTKTAKYWVSINGGAETEYSVSYTLPQAKTVSIIDKTITVDHKSDGTGTISVRTWMDTGINAGVITKSESLTLTTIPRAAKLSVSNGTLGTAQTIRAGRSSDDFTCTLEWKSGTHSGTIATKSTSRAWNFTPSLDLADGAPNGTSVYCSFTLTTYNGSTSVGSVTKAVWLTIPDSVKPTCSIALSDKNGYATKFGGYIQGQSRLHGVITGNGACGSKISSYSTSANSSIYSGSTFDTGVLLYSGNIVVSTTVKDSRGRSASAESTINVLAYSAPKITRLSVIRCNSDGTENDRGSYAKVTYSYSITSLSNLNSKGAVLKYKKSSETAWQSVTLTAAYIASDQTTVIPADDGSSYDVALFISDDFYKDGTAVKSQTSVSTGYCLYHVHPSGKGITFGGVSESEGFNVKMSAHFYNGLAEDIRVAPSGDCNTLLTSGNYYIGETGKNKPGTGLNGWLTVKAYGENSIYCYQEYVTYTGERYYRMRDNGTWNAWLNRSPYPVGSIYMSINSTSPATLFGGTWERIQGQFLLGASSTYSAGSTGGEASHTLTESETPNHYHDEYLGNSSGPDSTPSGYTGWPTADSTANKTWWVKGSKTSSTGGGGAHNNMPPYLAVYIWKRTA